MHIKKPRQHGEIGFPRSMAVVFLEKMRCYFLVITRSLRRAFSDGALFAAQWLSNKKAGLHSMQDALQLKIVCFYCLNTHKKSMPF